MGKITYSVFGTFRENLLVIVIKLTLARIKTVFNLTLVSVFINKNPEERRSRVLKSSSAWTPSKIRAKKEQSKTAQHNEQAGYVIPFVAVWPKQKTKP
jgi:hypothetical protein